MALILCIETATTVCSVALASGKQLLACKEENAKNTHSEHITLFIEDVMKQAGKNLSDVDAFAVSMGPVHTQACGSVFQLQKDYVTHLTNP